MISVALLWSPGADRARSREVLRQRLHRDHAERDAGGAGPNTERDGHVCIGCVVLALWRRYACFSRDKLLVLDWARAANVTGRHHMCPTKIFVRQISNIRVNTTVFVLILWCNIVVSSKSLEFCNAS